MCPEQFRFGDLCGVLCSVHGILWDAEDRSRKKKTMVYAHEEVDGGALAELKPVLEKTCTAYVSQRWKFGGRMIIQRTEGSDMDRQGWCGGILGVENLNGQSIIRILKGSLSLGIVL